jgi:hypothetical protein
MIERLSSQWLCYIDWDCESIRIESDQENKMLIPAVDREARSKSISYRDEGCSCMRVDTGKGLPSFSSRQKHSATPNGPSMLPS